jgi:hypothetical protein
MENKFKVDSGLWERSGDVLREIVRDNILFAAFFGRGLFLR